MPSAVLSAIVDELAGPAMVTAGYVLWGMNQPWPAFEPAAPLMYWQPLRIAACNHHTVSETFWVFVTCSAETGGKTARYNCIGLDVPAYLYIAS